MNNPFSCFIDFCQNMLGFLVSEYSFKRNEPRIVPPECSIEYRKDNYIIDVIYEYGDFPWIRITIDGKENSLDNIIKKNWPEFIINRKKGPKEPEKRINTAIEQYSKALKKHVLEIGGLVKS